MIDFFQYDTDEKRRSLLVRARKVALLALQQYDLDGSGLNLFNYRTL